MIIFGAGMAGCLAGVLNNDSRIYESKSAENAAGEHKAVLRFRTDRIGRITGIPFEKVMVRKAIWFEQREHQKPEIRFINMYSKKVSGSFMTRSIVNLDTVERFVPPLNFHEILLSLCKGRVFFNHSVQSVDQNSVTMWPSDGPTTAEPKTVTVNRTGDPVVSTLAMNVNSRITGIPCPLDLRSVYVEVTRFRLPGANLHQTLYYPAPVNEIPVYRASIIRDILTIETLELPFDPEQDKKYYKAMFDPEQALQNYGYREVLNSFGLHPNDVVYLDQGRQLGKISPVDDNVRKQYIFDLTMKAQMYSLGRFAIWSNVLLDDVYDDILKIRQFIESHSHYDAYKHAVGAV